MITRGWKGILHALSRGSPLSQFFSQSVCIFHVRAHSQARPFIGSVMHVGVLSIQFNKKSIDRVFVAGMRFIAGSSQLLEKNV